MPSPVGLALTMAFGGLSLRAESSLRSEFGRAGVEAAASWVYVHGPTVQPPVGRHATEG